MLIDLFIHTILLCAGIFGIYAVTRLITLHKTHAFYLIWLTSHSLMFLMYFALKTGTFDAYPILYRSMSPLYFFAPASLYLFFSTLIHNHKTRWEYFLHLLPAIIILTITIFETTLYHNHVIGTLKSFQAQIQNPTHESVQNPFKLEKVLFALRSIIGLIYIRLIHGALKKKTQTHGAIHDSWQRVFQPIRINIYIVVIFLVPTILIKEIFQIGNGKFVIINAVVVFAAFMFFKHIHLLLRDLEKPNSIFKSQAQEVHNRTTQTLDIPEKSLFILHQIYKDQLYLDPMLGIGKIATVFGSTEEKFSLFFNNTVPFSFTSYINYLRILHFEQHSNDKFSKEANIINAGFNSRASYYQWEKRKSKLAGQINPVLESFNHPSQPQTPSHQETAHAVTPGWISKVQASLTKL